jgi:hypothetical protein
MKKKNQTKENNESIVNNGLELGLSLRSAITLITTV